jgi:hypothetical protein
MTKIVYVSVYRDFFWKLSPRKFLKLCNDGMKHGTVDIDNYGKRLKKHPRGYYTYSSKTGQKKTGLAKTGDIRWYDILDWRYEDFKDAYEEIKKWAKTSK